MQILLIFPRKERKFKRSYSPPYNLAILAARTPADIDIKILDEDIEDIDYDIPVDLVGITVQTPHAINAYKIAKRFREKGKKVVLGGSHVSLLPDEAQQHADCVVIGEADETWPVLLEDFKKGKLKETYRAGAFPDLKNLPLPRTDLFNKKKYFFPHQVSITRGCNHQCRFCGASGSIIGPLRYRPMEDIFAELESIISKTNKTGYAYLPRAVYFVDYNIGYNHDFSKQFLKTLIPYKIKWIGAGSVNNTKDDELMELLQKSGCLGLAVGFESINQESLIEAGKSLRVEDFEGAISKFHKYKISIEGIFLLGFDHDDETIFERTLQFCRQTKLELAEFEAFTPYPGTTLYKELESQGRILTREWSKYDIEVVFQPRLMSAEALEKGTKWVQKEFYKLSSMMKRLGIFKLTEMSLNRYVS